MNAQPRRALDGFSQAAERNPFVPISKKKGVSKNGGKTTPARRQDSNAAKPLTRTALKKRKRGVKAKAGSKTRCKPGFKRRALKTSGFTF
jgi:hypothetical protein